MTISRQSSKTIVLRFFCCGLSGASLPSCFSEVVRVCEANLNVLENMSSKEPMYSAEQALEKIWNDSGDEGDLFDGNESEFEVYSASEDESDEFSADASSSRENSAEHSEESSDDEAQGCGDGGNRVRQSPARQQEAPLLWRMARGTTPRVIPFTGNSGVQVLTEGF